MVCYNITAYNEIINFTVSKREVYNSKLRAGIKAERGMVMKGKNLERAVILGLILSAGIYGTAWATEIPEKWSPKVEGDKLILSDVSETITNTANYTYQGKNISEFGEVEVFFEASKDGVRPIGVYSERFDWDDVDLTIHVTGNYNNNDALHFTNFDPYINLKSLTIDMQAKGSDAINLSRNISGNANVHLNCDLYATVKDGNGIRANASIKGEHTASIVIMGNTNITIKTNAGTLLDVMLGKDVQLVPTAVWAGTDADFRENQKSKGKGEIYLNGDTKITLDGKGNYGLSSGKNGYITVNNLDITANRENSYGLSASDINVTFDMFNFSDNKYGSILELNGKINNIVMNGNNSYAIYAQGKDINNNSNTVKSGEEGIGGLNVKGNILAKDSGAIDLTINNDKIIDEDNKVNENYVTVEGDILAKSGGTVNMAIKNTAGITGNIEAVGTDSKINIGGLLKTDTQNFARSNDTGKTSINITGDVQAANGATIDLSLGDGAYFEGRVDDYKDADNKYTWDKIDHGSLFDEDFVNDNSVDSSGKVNLTLGNNAVWNLTEQSWVSKVDGNSGLIYLDGDGTGGYAVHIGKLEGDHTFVLNLNPKKHEFSDMLYIYDGSSAGVQNLRINNEAEVLNALKDDGDRIRFATVGKTAGAGAGFGDDYVVRGRGVINSGFSIDYVDYDTDTHEGNYNGGDSFTAAKPGDDYVDSIYGSGNNNSETGSQASTLENNAGTGNKPVAELDSKNLYLVRDSSKDAGKSDSGATIINMSRANYKNAIYMDRLNKRMGEMRYVNGEEEQGLWVRLRHDRIGQSGDFRSMNTMYEVGYDVKQPTDNGEHRIGMAIDYMRGSTTYDDIMGKGETKRYGLWLYDTWLGEKGHYTDYIVKWGHLSNDFDIRDKDSLENITGDYSNNVFSVSAEYGKKNDMGNNWYFEPQAQLQLARVTGADYVTTQGSKVNVDGINSLIGRAGFRIGRDMDENSTVYLKADLLHEFMGDQTVTAADATGTLREEFENKGTWYDVGFGFAAKMSKNSYAFMDFEKSFGNDNDETYQINAGMQWTF